MKRFLFGHAPAILLLAALGMGMLAARAEDRPQFTVCAYNLRNYLEMERSVHGKREPNQPKPIKQIEAIVRFLTDIHPDVLGVSEIGSTADLSDLQVRLKAAGVDLPNTEWTQGSDPDRHLALLTRYPIVLRNSQTELKYQMGDDVLQMKRGLLDVTLQPKPGFFVRCIGAHLKSKIPDADHAEDIMRRNEAHLLRLYVDKILTNAPDAQILVYGDFNDTKDSAPLREIGGDRNSSTALHYLNLTDSRQERWTHYWAQEDLYSRIDYMFTSHMLSPYINRSESRIYDPINYLEGSDHRPLVVKIYLSRK